jgi:hypothetical protein
MADSAFCAMPLSIIRQLEEDCIRTFVLGELREGEPGVELMA